MHVARDRQHANPSDVAELVNRLKAGRDTDATFRLLFERYLRPVSYFFANRGFSVDECRDLTQETFLGVFQSIGGYRADSSFEAWLFSIATNIWRNRVRSGKTDKRRGQEVSIQVVMEENLPPLSGLGWRNPPVTRPLERLLDEERLQQMRAALLDLPPQMRQCVLLRLDQEMKYREIAELMNIAVNTVKSQLAQAKERLKARLVEDFTDFQL